MDSAKIDGNEVIPPTKELQRLKLHAGITGDVLLMIDGGYQAGFFGKTISGNAWITVEELLETWNRFHSRHYREIFLDELLLILEANNCNWFRVCRYRDGRLRAVCSRCLGGKNNLPDE